MDRVSHNRNDAPPPKKRPRFHPPGFESSFHTVKSSKKHPHRGAASIRADISIDSHESTPTVLVDGRSRTTMRVMKPSDLALDWDSLASGLLSSAAEKGDNVVQSPLGSHRRKKKRVSAASFSEFTSAFDMPTLTFESSSSSSSKTVTLPAERHFSKASHTLSTAEDHDPKRRESGLVEATPRTPMRLLKPPSLREAIPHNPSISKNRSPLTSYPHDGASTTSDTNKAKLNSMMSHLPFLKRATALLASPKGPALEVDGKFLPLTPPFLHPEPLHDKAKPVSSSHVSHAQRAEILASSVRVSRKHLPTNVELTELARGVELSPQKGSRGQKLIPGGLAERAERLLLRSSTNFSLWHTGFVKRLESAQNTKEDLRLHVMSVLSFTRNHPRSSTSSVDALPRTAIARCREVRQDTTERNEGESSPHREGTVVFLFANHDRVSSVVRFEEGKDVCVWRPWREIELSEEVFDWRAKPEEEEEEEVMRPSTSFRFVTDAAGASNKRTALLCSRFVVMV